MERALIKKIDAANLSALEHALWMSFIYMSNEETLGLLLEEITNDPGKIEYLTNNMTAKIKAIQTRDAVSWEAIVKEEEKH